MGSSIPGVIDHLLTLANDAATTAGGNVLVDDGWPEALGERMFGVGIDSPPDQLTGEQASGTDAIFTMGNVGIKEEFNVPCYIWDSSGGVDQKACRDAAFAIYDPFLAAIKTDPSLGGTTLIGMIRNFAANGPQTPEEAARGRYCLLTFTVACTDLI